MRVTPLSETKQASPAQQLAQALYDACGRPRHMVDKARDWRQVAHQILSDEKYTLENVLGAIRWLPSNKFWRSRVTDMQAFKEHIDKILSEYHASILSQKANAGKRFDPFGMYWRQSFRAAWRKVDRSGCPECHGAHPHPTDELSDMCYFRDDGPPCQTCDAAKTELYRVCGQSGRRPTS